MKHLKGIFIRDPYPELKAQFAKIYGEHLGQFIAARLARMVKRCSDPSCADNLRIADTRYPESVEAYETAQKHGCCGSVDKSFDYTAPGGIESTTIKIGFNYGH